MATPRHLFTVRKQKLFTKLCKEQLPSSFKTSSQEIIKWLLSYINDEQFESTNAIRQDLQDNDYSAIRHNMQDKFNWNDKSTQIICNILLNNIFEPPLPQKQNSDSYISSIYDNDNDNDDEEEKKIFYGSGSRSSSQNIHDTLPSTLHSKSRQSSNNELGDAFIETIDGVSAFDEEDENKYLFIDSSKSFNVILGSSSHDFTVNILFLI